jgi:predicted DNA-binding transcriptional regulator AlpA
MLENDMESLLSQREVAILTGLSERTLERARGTGDGPKFVKLGRRIGYRPDDIKTWIASCVRTSTSEGRAQA